MGRMRKSKSSGVSRRSFLKGAGAATALIGAAPVFEANAQLQGDGAVLPAAVVAAGPFVHGVASGDPLADRVILWTRVTQTGTADVPVDYVVATDAALTQIVASSSGVATSFNDFTFKVDVAGLTADTTYYYRFTSLGADSPIGRTKTLPVGKVDRLRIAVVSCSSLGHGFFNAYRRIAERADLDAVVHLGDYIYEYGSNQYGSVRAYEPDHEIISLSDYRTRHSQYKRDADLQEVHRQHPMIAIWDDHEVANNSWAHGAENHQPATEGNYELRKALAIRVYFEWMPIRRAIVNGVDGPRTRIFREFSFGNLLDLFMLEDRLRGRSEQLTTNIGSAAGYFVQSGAYTDPSRGLLDSPQERWLFTNLRASGAQWKMIGQGVMFGQLKAQGAPNASGGGVFINSDQWDGYAPARERVHAVLRGDTKHTPISNAVVISGDIHSSWVGDVVSDPNNPTVASGGYDAASGAGSLGVEFVGTSITSPGVNDPGNATANFLKSMNPHFKYIDLNRRGYMLMDIDASRISTEYWYVDTVAATSPNETFGIAYQTVNGSRHVIASTQSAPKASPPALAP